MRREKRGRERKGGSGLNCSFRKLFYWYQDLFRTTTSINNFIVPITQEVMNSRVNTKSTKTPYKYRLSGKKCRDRKFEADYDNSYWRTH